MKNILKQLKTARAHAQKQLQRIDEALLALGSSTGTSSTMSVAGRRKISLAQKARWAKHRTGSQTAKPKRTMSAAAEEDRGSAARTVGEGEARINVQLSPYCQRTLRPPTVYQNASRRSGLTSFPTGSAFGLTTAFNSTPWH